MAQTESKQTKAKQTKAMQRLEASRQQAEQRLADVRTAISRELGWRPGTLWIAPIVAFGCGVVLARALARKQRDRSAG